MHDLSWLKFDESPEAQARAEAEKAEADARASIRADYQYFVCCQEMSEKELQQVIDEGVWNDEKVQQSFRDNHMAEDGFSTPAPMDEETKAHYLKRYRMACIVAEARGLVK